MPDMRAYNPGMQCVRRLGPIAIVVALGLVVPASATVTGTLVQVTTGSASAYQTTPAIAGNYLVWNNTSKTSTGATNQDIYWEDLTIGLAQNLTNTPDLQEFLEDIDGTNVVFTQTSATSTGDILVADLSARSIMAAPVASADPNGAWHYEQPAIGGRYIVYIKAGVGQADVAGYDNSIGLALPMITNDAAIQAAPRVSGEYVVYEDWGAGNADVYGFLMGHPPAFPIATGAHNQRTPDIKGNYIVWVDSVSAGEDQIWVYDLNSRLATQITTAVSNKLNPRLSGTRVVWSDTRNGDMDIYTYDLAAGVEDKLAGGTGDQMLADIDGNHIVFTSNANGFEQVYLFTISTPPPPVNVPIGCDPTKTDAVDAPVSMTRLTKLVINATRSFTPQPNKQYYVCVENGTATGTNRTDTFMLTVDNDVVLNPADFKPQNDPPHYVAAAILGDASHGPPTPGKHSWSAALFGNKIPSQVTVTLRASK
jgi:beta propeller repeat protein